MAGLCYLEGACSAHFFKLDPFSQRSKDALISALVGCIDCLAFFEDLKSSIMQNLFALEKILALAQLECVPVETKISKA